MYSDLLVMYSDLSAASHLYLVSAQATQTIRAVKVISGQYFRPLHSGASIHPVIASMLAIRTRPSSGDGNDTRGNSKQAFAQMKHIDGDSMVQFLGDGKSKPRKRLGNKKILQYWGVPKTNFDGKPPAHWGECLMNPDKLATLVPMGRPHVNWNDYFVVDKGIPR